MAGVASSESPPAPSYIPFTLQTIVQRPCWSPSLLLARTQLPSAGTTIAAEVEGNPVPLPAVELRDRELTTFGHAFDDFESFHAAARPPMVSSSSAQHGKELPPCHFEPGAWSITPDWLEDESPRSKSRKGRWMPRLWREDASSASGSPTAIDAVDDGARRVRIVTECRNEDGSVRARFEVVRSWRQVVDTVQVLTVAHPAVPFGVLGLSDPEWAQKAKLDLLLTTYPAFGTELAASPAALLFLLEPSGLRYESDLTTVRTWCVAPTLELKRLLSPSQTASNGFFGFFRRGNGPSGSSKNAAKACSRLEIPVAVEATREMIDNLREQSAAEGKRAVIHAKLHNTAEELAEALADEAREVREVATLMLGSPALFHVPNSRKPPFYARHEPDDADEELQHLALRVSATLHLEHDFLNEVTTADGFAGPLLDTLTSLRVAADARYDYLVRHVAASEAALENIKEAVATHHQLPPCAPSTSRPATPSYGGGSSASASSEAHRRLALGVGAVGVRCANLIEGRARAWHALEEARRTDTAAQIRTVRSLYLNGMQQAAVAFERAERQVRPLSARRRSKGTAAVEENTAATGPLLNTVVDADVLPSAETAAAEEGTQEGGHTTEQVADPWKGDS